MKRNIISTALVISILVFTEFTLNQEKKKIPPLQFVDIRNVLIMDSFCK